MRIDSRTQTTPLPLPGVTPTPETSLPLPTPSLSFATPDQRRVSGSDGGTSALGLSDLDRPLREAEKPQWTLAMNLTTTQENRFGAAPKAQQLRDLAKETEGKPVTIVAQQISVKDDQATLERFVIKDGKVNSLGERPSRGFAQDLEDLTTWAASDHPAERMGVVIQSHGAAIRGMAGDNGDASLAEIAEALQEGLVMGGRTQLDLLNFDACLMGQHEVLNAMAGIAEHVVASSELELANGRMLGGMVDGQPTEEMIRALLENPEMDGRSLAQKTVELASQAKRPFDVDGDGKADANGLMLNATPTLAHFDMGDLDMTVRAMDDLGSTLSEAMQDPTQRAVIEDLITRTPRFSGDTLEFAAPGLQQRDLKSFAEKLLTAVADGKLTDPSGSLSQAATASLEALNELVEAYHGEEDGSLDNVTTQNYRAMGGFGVFLPSAEFARGTPETMRSPLERIQLHAADVAKQFDESAEKGPLRGLRDIFLGGASRELSLLRPSLDPKDVETFKLLDKAYHKAENAGPGEFADAVREFAATARQAQAEGIDRPAMETLNQHREAMLDQAYQQAGPNLPAGWRQFLGALRTGE